MGRRTLLLITSILIAAIGTALIGLYVQGADDRAGRDGELVTVLVADRPIAVGSSPAVVLRSATARQVTRQSAQNGFGGADPAARLQADQKDKVVITPVLANQVIVTSMFGESGSVAQGEITKDRAVTIVLSDPARVTGLLRPGSLVTIYHLTGGPTPERVLGNVRVIRVGNEAGSGAPATRPATGRGGAAVPGDDVPRTIVALDLTISQSETIIAAQSSGELYFALQAGREPEDETP